jgi:hypothetical protein
MRRKRTSLHIHPFQNIQRSNKNNESENNLLF